MTITRKGKALLCPISSRWSRQVSHCVEILQQKKEKNQLCAGLSPCRMKEPQIKTCQRCRWSPNQSEWTVAADLWDTPAGYFTPSSLSLSTLGALLFYWIHGLGLNSELSTSTRNFHCSQVNIQVNTAWLPHSSFALPTNFPRKRASFSSLTSNLMTYELSKDSISQALLAL